MAAVYLSRDIRHQRPVAIKVMRPEIGIALGADRFLREIEILAALTHPNILQLFDSGEAGRLLYYVMPFVEGASLRELMVRNGGRMPVTDAVRLTRSVVTALDYAHRRGVVHRDIKPENILIWEEVPLVADFGIALSRRASSGRDTDSGLALGTPIYMSPEQATGESQLDGRSDLYSVGCVLFEMLAGELPFTGENTMAITASKLVDPVPDVKQVRDDVPDELKSVLERSLRVDPAERFATAAEFAQALAVIESILLPLRATLSITAPETGSVAVLPFANLSADADTEFFSDGMTEEILHALSEVDGLHVVARTSSFRFKGKNVDLREVGRALGVSHVLEGSVRQAGDQVRITAKLVEAAGGYQVWSDRFDRRMVDVFAVQDEIAHAIMKVIAARLLAARKESRPPAPARRTADKDAYEWYLKGRYHWNRRTVSELELGIACFSQAIAADPGYARAHAGLADSLLILGVYGMRSPESVMNDARLAALQALSLDPTLAEAVTTLGCVRAMYDWDWASSDADFRRAIALDPKYPTARQWYAINCLAPQGRFGEASAQLELASEQDPLSSTIHISTALLHIYERDFPRAERTLLAFIKRDPDFGVAWYFLGELYTAADRYDEAVAALNRATELTERSAETVAALARAHALASRTLEANTLLRELEERARGDEYVSPALFAQVRLGLGEKHEALELLEKAVEVRAADVVWLSVDPCYDGVREEPRFVELLKTIGLAEPES
jgi:TolB-like protein/cytochrome c-type biogenesis protein CcmH/NrfG